MIPNPDSPQGIALGNQIVAYVLGNFHRFGIQDAIWRGVYYTSGGAQPNLLGGISTTSTSRRPVVATQGAANVPRRLNAGHRAPGNG